MNDYWYTVMFISTVLGFVGGLAGAILATIAGFCDDLRWLFLAAALVLLAVLSLSWGLVYGG